MRKFINTECWNFNFPNSLEVIVTEPLCRPWVLLYEEGGGPAVPAAGGGVHPLRVPHPLHLLQPSPRGQQALLLRPWQPHQRLYARWALSCRIRAIRDIVCFCISVGTVNYNYLKTQTSRESKFYQQIYFKGLMRDCFIIPTFLFCICLSLTGPMTN